MRGLCLWWYNSEHSDTSNDCCGTLETASVMAPGLGTWPVNCHRQAAALSLVQSDHQSQLLQRPGSPEGQWLSILFAAIIARPARLPRGSTKHWDLPVLQMGKCTSRDYLNSRETIIFHWKCQDLCGTGLKGAATDRRCSICLLWFTLRLRRKQNPIPHQF